MHICILFGLNLFAFAATSFTVYVYGYTLYATVACLAFCFLVSLFAFMRQGAEYFGGAKPIMCRSIDRTPSRVGYIFGLLTMALSISIGLKLSDWYLTFCFVLLSMTVTYPLTVIFCFGEPID